MTGASAGRSSTRIRPTHRVVQEHELRSSWPGITIGATFEAAVTERPDVVAVVDRDVTLTFGEVGRRAGVLAEQLASIGVGRGDVVGVQLPNWWETYAAYAAASLLGAVCNPLVPLLRRHELSFIFHQARPAAVLVPARFRSTDYLALHREVRDEVSSPPETLVVRRTSDDAFTSARLEPDADEESRHAAAARPPVSHGSSQEIALLMYTSGTTSDPKGVLHHHDALVYEVRSIVELFGLTADDTIFMVSPLSHISGYLFAFLLGSMVGAPTVLQDVWDPEEAVELIERHRCRFTLAAPVFLRGIVEAYRRRGQRSSLRAFLCGGADVPSDLVASAREVLGAEVVRTYGLTEMPTLASGRPGGGVANVATDGYVISPASCRIDSAGELLVRGPELFCGYLDPAHNEAFTADGYFRTGDLARLGDDGSVTILGRAKDVIVRGGEKISAREVEDLLARHPEVAEVAVVPVRDRAMGERVGAVVVARTGDRPDVASLGAHLTAAGLARQKHPEHVVLVDELPRTASGKVQRHLLRDQFQAGDSARV